MTFYLFSKSGNGIQASHVLYIDFSLKIFVDVVGTGV
jgi:hypothetical protein